LDNSPTKIGPVDPIGSGLSARPREKNHQTAKQLRLASTGQDGTIKLWDARPLTAELQTERRPAGAGPSD
jgi:hypothetical protein